MGEVMFDHIEDKLGKVDSQAIKDFVDMMENSQFYYSDDCKLVRETASYQALKALLDKPAALEAAFNHIREATNMVDTDKLEDGWIEWKGGKQPVENGIEVEVILKNFPLKIWPPKIRKAEAWVWEHYGNDDDIIAYRIIEEKMRNDGNSQRNPHALGTSLYLQWQLDKDKEYTEKLCNRKLAEMYPKEEVHYCHDARFAAELEEEKTGWTRVQVNPGDTFRDSAGNLCAVLEEEKEPNCGMREKRPADIFWKAANCEICDNCYKVATNKIPDKPKGEKEKMREFFEGDQWGEKKEPKKPTLLEYAQKEFGLKLGANNLDLNLAIQIVSKYLERNK